ncbi:hypothetical protein LZ554_002562 [Drepanopeziza brunnea f. sp. 'monogermtubi']|nr:hypothetical protein LZ554_002562 [Drepanopeziza brunnea f. sp. 'monogermtubi']
MSQQTTPSSELERPHSSLSSTSTDLDSLTAAHSEHSTFSFSFSAETDEDTRSSTSSAPTLTEDLSSAALTAASTFPETSRAPSPGPLQQQQQQQQQDPDTDGLFQPSPSPPSPPPPPTAVEVTSFSHLASELSLFASCLSASPEKPCDEEDVLAQARRKEMLKRDLLELAGKGADGREVGREREAELLGKIEKLLVGWREVYEGVEGWRHERKGERARRELRRAA